MSRVVASFFRRWVAHRSGRGWWWLLGWLLVATARAQTPLNLPFFDDFSTASGRPGLDVPNPTRWQPGSGVYINNTMSVNHPTVNMASFDGLRANGLPYVQNNQLARGYTDTLQSRPITLAGLTAADSVYLSFYWQAKGLGELPNFGDSLTVQFLDNTGTWQTVWTQEGGTPTPTFAPAFVPVRNPAFFHAGFTFRFRSFGLQSGPFNTWNVDYVYLNRGRSLFNRYVRDVAMRQQPSPLLRRYSAMPLTQYVVNPAAETADTVGSDMNNLFPNFNRVTPRFRIVDEVTGRVVQNANQLDTVSVPALSARRLRVRPAVATGLTNRAVLRYTFDLLTTDDQNPSIPGVDLRQNDTLSARAVLDDYYAYDDGTWEYGVQVGPRESLAVRFILNKPDVLAGVRAAIVPFKTNQSGQSFVVSVYSNDGGRPGTAIYRQGFAIQYPTYRNGFVDFRFASGTLVQGIAVRDTFFVGYQQISQSDTTFLRLGVDKNSPFGSQIFYNGGTNWVQNGQISNANVLNLQGALMLRPIMGGQANVVVTALTEPVLPALRTYPNPTSGLIRWDNPRLTRLDVLNLTGQLLLTHEPARGTQTLDLGFLPDGLYLLRLYEGDRTAIQKVIISH